MGTNNHTIVKVAEHFFESGGTAKMVKETPRLAEMRSSCLTSLVADRDESDAPEQWPGSSPAVPPPRARSSAESTNAS